MRYKVLVCWAVGVWGVQAWGAVHPLEPLTSQELASVVACVKKHASLQQPWFFVDVALEEPAKELLKKDFQNLPRQAHVVVFEKNSNSTHTYVLDVACQKPLQHQVFVNSQPYYTVEELEAVPSLLRADKRWQKAMRQRGIKDFENVQIDPWALGVHDTPLQGKGVRLVRALSFYGKDTRHAYWRPVEGVTALVDLTHHKVLEVCDEGVVPVPVSDPQVRVESASPEHKAALPYGFVVKDHEVKWDRWKVRFAMTPREGLVVYDVAFHDQNRWRSVMHRGSLSEMVVPYGDPSPAWSFRNAFDEGEYGLGRLASPLVPGKDMPHEAYYEGADFVNDQGEVVHLPRVVAVYERASGMLWKHYDPGTGETDARMGKELWISYSVTVGNYDYGLSWVFKQDGSMEWVADLTGILLAKGVKQDTCTLCEKPRKGESTHALLQPEPYSTLVGKGVAAPYHQHFFNVRLDMDIEEGGNSVLQMDTQALPLGAQNPKGGAFVMEETVLRSEKEAMCDVNLASSRMWKVFHPHAKTALGHLPGYVLVPQENSVTYLHPKAEIRLRAPFVEHALYVTAYHPNERHAAGDYPNQSMVSDGLNSYVGNDETLVNQDVVLWYSLGVTHIPRPEDWPMMPRHRTGFKLLPSGFFERNPSLL